MPRLVRGSYFQPRGSSDTASGYQYRSNYSDCDERTSARLFVSMSASTSPELHVRSLPNFPWLGPPLPALQHVMYFHSKDDVIFAHIGPYSGMSRLLQQVTSLRRRAQANIFAAWYWRRRVLEKRLQKFIV